MAKKVSAANTAAVIPAKKKKGRLRENIEAIIIAVLVALLLRAFVVQAFKIPSASMEETLLIGDHLLVNKFIYGVKIPGTDKKLFKFSDPKSGDIIVFKFPEDEKVDFIKRVVAVASDTVEIRDKALYVNGQKINTPQAQYKDSNIYGDPRGYKTFDSANPMNFFTFRDSTAGIARRDNMPPLVVPPGSLFVMGDNRDESHDSRFWGFVEITQIKGKAMIIYWSWNNEKTFPRFNRIAKILR